MATKKPDVIVENGSVYVLRAGMQIFVKTADICSMTGKSNQWIGQLSSQGSINKQGTPHGNLYPLRETVKSYCAMLEERGTVKDQLDEKQEKARAAAETTIRVSKANIAKLEADELQGKMHRSEDVAVFMDDIIFTMRAALMALPGRLAVDVAAAQSAAEASDIIRKEVNKIMSEIAEHQYDPKAYAERVRDRMNWAADTGDDDDGE